MPTELTEQQQTAVEIRDVSIALSAGAGCGKTHVLTERFLAHLDPESADATQPNDLHQLIAITFTDAAAREMRTRIREKCRKRLQTAPAEHQHDWLTLLRAIETARVSTIHAFCSSLLRDHAVAAGLDPLFGVLEQGAADVLLSETIDDVLREKLAAQDNDTLELASEYGLARVKNQIAELLTHRHEAAFRDWLSKTPDEAVTAWQACYVGEAFHCSLREIVAKVSIAEMIRLLHAIAPKKDIFIAAKADLLELLPRLVNGSVTVSELETIRNQARVRGLCTAKDWPSAEAYEAYTNACKAVRDAIERHALQPFDESIALETARLGLALLQLTNDVVQAYEARKAAENKLDFNDLLANARRLLTDPAHDAIRQQLSSQLSLVLVDEFQDTNPLQVEVVNALSGGVESGRLFFVGDIKQSIYRFNGARPEVFRKLRDEVTDRGRLPLTRNFRSQPAILNFVNALFVKAFGVEYEPLRPNRPQNTAQPAVEFLWAITPEKNSNHKGAALEARREEARWIARRLRALVDSDDERPIIDEATGQPRSAQLGDIAILFRALSDIQVYEEALRAYELDYYLVGGRAFYSQQEIFDVLNLLRAVASPADEISLAGALRSPFFALADETLFWLVKKGGGSLSAGLLANVSPAELTPEERAKTVAAAETLRQLRGQKDHLAIAELLREAVARTGYDATLLAEFLGERKLANLHKLLEQARTADRGALDLDGFITELAQFTSRQPKEALAATSPETANVIRLMTIHQAKGLEFPLVVVADLDRKENAPSDPAALHAELGPLVPPPDEDDKKSATGMQLYRTLEKSEEREERKRLLYVATTRAADYLILSSSLEGLDKPKSDWMQLIAERFDLGSGQLKAEIPAAYGKPTVRVAPEEPVTDHKPAGSSRGPDLLKLLEDAHLQAISGRGGIPPEVAPIPVDRAARVQFSFSRLTGQLVRGERPRSTYNIEQRPGSAMLGIDPRDFGSLVHAVLQRIDFSGDKETIRQWCEQLASEYVVLHAAEAGRQAWQMIERFLGSERGRQIAKATAIHREVEFLLAWPPDNIGDHSEQSRIHGHYLQGYMDCLYQNSPEGWHLLDYKTNDISAAEVPQVARRYEMQLYVYALAIERSLGIPPLELVLHFLRPGIEYCLPWNDEARHRAAQLINEAITALVSSSNSDL